MRKIIDTRDIQTAADLLRFLREAEDLGYDLDTMYLHTENHDVGKIALVQETLTDGSTVCDFHLAA